MTNTTQKDIETRIETLKNSGETIQETIQQLALDCLAHAEENDGDFTLMTKLYAALPRIVRRGTFVAWVKHHAPARFVTKKNKAGAKVKTFKKDKNENANPFDYNGAVQTPIHKFEAPQGLNEAEPLTCEELEKKVLNFLTRLEKKGNMSSDVRTRIESIREAAEVHSVAH